MSGFSDRAWGSRSVTIGHDVPAKTWASAVDSALASFPYLLNIENRDHDAISHPLRYVKPEVRIDASEPFANAFEHPYMKAAALTLVAKALMPISRTYLQAHSRKYNEDFERNF